MILLGTGEASAHITSSNYQAKRVKYERVKDHAEDVFRFFKNHPKPANSTIGHRVLRAQRAYEKRAEGKLNEIQEFVYSGQFLPYVWQVIVRCETHTNWQHNSGTYQGAFGFHHQSWDSFNTFGYPSEAYLATPEQQYRVALAIYHRYGFSGWGCA